VLPRISFRSLLWLLALALSTVHAESQAVPAENGDRTVFRTVAPTVVVDVTVSNRLGHPLGGLTSRDFEVLENGERQAITSFQEHTGQSNEISQPRPPEPPDIFSNAVRIDPPDSLDVLLLDPLNTRLDDQAFVRQQAILYLKRLPPGAHIAIFLMSTRLVFVQSFTSDAAVLLAALGQKETDPQFSPLLKTRADDTAEQEEIGKMESLATSQGSAVFQASILAMQQFLDENNTSQTSDRADITLKNLRELGRYLAGIPGRKNVIWFSGAFPASIYPGVASKDAMPRFYNDEIKKTSEVLAAARVAIYPIDARGLQTNSFYDASLASAPSGGQSASLRLEGILRAVEEATMDELAVRTGGKAFYNTNGLADAMNEVVGNGGRFYTLTYTPSDRRLDGEFRKIVVKTAKGSYSLGYRRGYYAVSPQEALADNAAQLADPLHTFMGLGMPIFDQVHYKALIVPAIGASNSGTLGASGSHKREAPAAAYHVNFAIPVGDLTFALSPDGVRHCVIEVSLVAYDRYGAPVYSQSKPLDLALDPNLYAASERTGVQIHEAIDLPKGDLWLRTGIFDRASARVGTLEVPMSSVVAQESGH